MQAETAEAALRPVLSGEERLALDAIKVLKHLQSGAPVPERMAVESARQLAHWIARRVPASLAHLPRGYHVQQTRSGVTLVHETLSEDFLLGCTGRAARLLAADCATGWLHEVQAALVADRQDRCRNWIAVKVADRKYYAAREELWQAIDLPAGPASR